MIGCAKHYFFDKVFIVLHQLSCTCYPREKREKDALAASERFLPWPSHPSIKRKNKYWCIVLSSVLPCSCSNGCSFFFFLAKKKICKNLHCPWMRYLVPRDLCHPQVEYVMHGSCWMPIRGLHGRKGLDKPCPTPLDWYLLNLFTKRFAFLPKKFI